MPRLIDLRDLLMTLSHSFISTISASPSVLLPSSPVSLSLKSTGKYPLASPKAEYSPNILNTQKPLHGR